jgi:hypothetical protein
MPQIVKKSAPAERLDKVNPISKAKYEAAMQKQWKSRPENQMKSAPKSAVKATSAPKGVMKKTTKY